MPIVPVVGPAGAGKSQYIEERRQPGDVIIDFTALWAALTGARRGPDGKYPERSDTDPILPFVAAVKGVALSMALDRGLRGYVTGSAREDVLRLDRITDSAPVIVDPGQKTIIERLRDPVTGAVSEECQKAIRRWYREG